jgi:glycosyltransferase involved in cell wall biosynthesis
MSHRDRELARRVDTNEQAMTERAGVEPIRVTMVVRLFDPWVGGMERQSLKLASRMVERGLRVEILTGRWFTKTPRVETIAGVTVTRHHTLWNGTGVRGIRRIGALVYMITLAWHLWSKRSERDVIHAHGLSYHAFISAVVGRKTRTPVVVKLANSGQASDIAKMRAGKHLPLTRLMLPAALRADRFVALNDLIVSELESAGVPSRRIARIPNGVELDPATRSYRLGNATKILFIGRLHRQKAIEDLLRAIGGLLPKPVGRELECTLVGDGPERAALEALCSELELGAHVRFAGQVNDVGPHLQLADVLVLPSRAEGLSNTLLEAMSSGLPVVASDISANRALIEHGVNGMLFPAADHVALQDVLEVVLERDDLRERLGREARRTVELGYSIDRIAAQYESLYADLTQDVEEPQ